MEGIRAAACLSLKLDIRERVNLLVEDYAHFVIDTEHLGQQLDFLTSIHGKEKITQWKTLASQHDIQTLVRKLLEEHYDPAYHKSINKNFLSLWRLRKSTCTELMTEYARGNQKYRR
jgi:tRNA 2-selenouridine synthase